MESEDTETNVCDYHLLVTPAHSHRGMEKRQRTQGRVCRVYDSQEQKKKGGEHGIKEREKGEERERRKRQGLA